MQSFCEFAQGNQVHKLTIKPHKKHKISQTKTQTKNLQNKKLGAVSPNYSMAKHVLLGEGDDLLLMDFLFKEIKLTNCFTDFAPMLSAYSNCVYDQ